jgi:hypothetical protein
MPHSSNDDGIPAMTFIKDGSFEQLVRCTRYLHTYAAGWRAVFFNLVAVTTLVLIGCSLSVGADFAKWLWWAYIVVLILLLISIYFVRNLFVYLYDSLRWLPEAIQINHTKSLLLMKWRAENLANDKAVWDKAMQEIQDHMDPTTIRELRKRGFL